jgi:hypothetical protein
MSARPMMCRLRFPRPAARFATGLALAGALMIGDTAAVNATDFTFVCPGPPPCRPQAGPGPADRQVQPFTGSLGRPCAYRWRETPSGPRKVRVCF